MQAKFDALNDQHLRLAAEYDNFRKRSQRERESLHAEAVAYAVKAMLPTYDNLERALKAETADAEYKKGVELTMTQLVESLKGIGVEKVMADPGTEFDPNLHNAVMHIENEELGENVIAEVFQQGFQIGGKGIATRWCRLQTNRCFFNFVNTILTIKEIIYHGQNHWY